MNAQAAAASILSQAKSLASQERWLVLVCPKGSSFTNVLNAIAPSILDADYYGRTYLLSDKSKLSIVDVSSPVFIPSDQTFTVVFVGWGNDLISGADEMNSWRTRASRVLCL